MRIEKIGIIGIGMLGNAVALRLIDSGFEVTVYNSDRFRF
jgi:3-hydroxyisobutyrate dehydrogenase